MREEDAVQRVATRVQILSCVRCGLRQGCTRPVPFSGDNPSPIVVVGEAPGKEEDLRGRPFVGPSGTFLRQRLDEAMGVEGWNEGLGFVNVVSCYPGRTPTSEEVRACGENLTSQLRMFEPWYVLVLGGVAVGAFWPRLRVGEVRGRWWCQDGLGEDLGGSEGTGRRVWCFATAHPSAVLRSGGQTSQIGRVFVEDLRNWAKVVSDWKRPGLNVDCVKCGRGDRKGVAEVWERNLGACKKHAEQAGIGIEGIGGGGGRTDGRVSSARGRQGGERRKAANPYVTSRQRRGSSPTPGTLFG